MDLQRVRQEERKTKRFTATVVGFPNCTVEADSRDEAIERARDAVGEFVAEAELVTIEIETRSQQRSLHDFAGMWADDDTFDEFVEAMKTHRRQVDTSETTSRWDRSYSTRTT